jgi:hypothetical protein
VKKALANPEPSTHGTFYLAAVELQFLHGSRMGFQILLSTKRDAVPITRRTPTRHSTDLADTRRGDQLDRPITFGNGTLRK